MVTSASGYEEILTREIESEVLGRQPLKLNKFLGET
jgi:hypothetical protein